MNAKERRAALAAKLSSTKKELETQLTPDTNDPTEMVAWWQAVYELADQKRWEAAKKARKKNATWPDIGTALNTTAGSARITLKNRET